MAKIVAGGRKHTVTKKKEDRGAGKKGDIIVEQNSKSGKKERMNLTKLAGSKTVKQGVKATKKFHKEHPGVK
ncbi:hypothetical protein UFOVP325_132 [uncultured Caudovirales phage]|uniref:Uncharacterized protein n=1 Tax=uncultured Caudovirales phage TaxID=2100421 RepID=A0A6J5MM65_9CAUD|nr:hypothetical protein UFOVP325_132 [uncultured Caudovirales phage]CAB4148155.1 hypothetical protein UFOVP430_127 [uncultured Caudovirales phage]